MPLRSITHSQDLNYKEGMTKQRFALPVVRGNRSSFPRRALCPVCKRRKVLEPHTMVLLSGGACLQVKGSSLAGPDKQMTAFLDIVSHTAHDSGSGRRDKGDGWVRIAEDVHGGQFDIAFCSPRCLRQFLGSCVDQLERQMALGRARQCAKSRKPSKK